MREASANYYLSDPRLAASAISQEPVWLWRPDGSQALWANAAGAEIFGARNIDAMRARRFENSDQAAQQVVRLNTSLPLEGRPRLERLHGFEAGPLLRPLVCACSRITLIDGTAAILISGVESTGRFMNLNERTRRLFGEADDTLAAFTLAGDLIYAGTSAKMVVGSATNVAAVGATTLAADAINEGRSAGSLPLGTAEFWRIGRESEMVLLARFEPAPKKESVAASTGVEPAATSSPPQKSEVTSASADILPTSAAGAKVTPPATARRHPLRFVWHLDAEQNFTLTSDEFIDIAGPITAQKNGAPWSEICAALALDPSQQVANAVATRDTWSGIVLSWPASTGDHIKVELSGLPIFDRQREFTGYRGFGVCRDLTQLEKIAQRRRLEARQAVITEAAAASPFIAPEASRPVLSVVPSSPNVVPFPTTFPPLEPRTPGLNAGERKAFSDIAQQLAARLKNNARPENVERDANTPPLATSRTARFGAGIDGRAPSAAGESDDGSDVRNLLDHLPIGVLVYRAHEMLFANREFLNRTGYATLTEFSERGGFDNLLLASTVDILRDGRHTISIAAADGKSTEIDARLISLPFGGEPAHALLFTEPAARERSSIRDPAYDRTAEKMLEQQIGELRRLADKTGADHEEFLKRIGHDLRTPLTAIVGFAEAILSENFGPIGNERYRDYLGGIRNAAERILALIEAFDREPQSETKSDKPAVAKESTVDLNTIVQSCVSELQPEASRERVLIRTSLARPLPSVAADMNAVRQIVLNLMTNSIKLAGAGGQVIISTGVSGAGSVSLRLRDTGIGVNENDVAAALGTASMEKAADGSEGRLKLAIAKALVEANRASLKISSRPNDGTLVEVSFRETMPPPAA